MKIDIIYKDPSGNWIAINKPVGISIHNDEDSINLKSILIGQFACDIFFPHRLDKETSGIQLVAFNKESTAYLSKLFSEHDLEKTYMGIVCGKLKTSKGIWVNPISDKAEGRNNPSGQKVNLQESKTEFEILNQNNFFTLVKFNLLTGRQHQIRKHCVINGHALVGDERYGNEKYNKKITELYKVTRMMLHCSDLKLNNQFHIQAPMPLEFDQIFSNLQIP